MIHGILFCRNFILLQWRVHEEAKGTIALKLEKRAIAPPEIKVDRIRRQPIKKLNCFSSTTHVERKDIRPPTHPVGSVAEAALS